MSVAKLTLGLAGEYAVASELCRRGLYTQLTLGNYKSADLLAMSETGITSRIEVKAKMGPKWANIKGVSTQGAFIVFVDFSGKPLTERPAFYVLSPEDWRALAVRAVKEMRARNPQLKVEIDESNCLVFPNKLPNRAGLIAAAPLASVKSVSIGIVGKRLSIFVV